MKNKFKLLTVVASIALLASCGETPASSATPTPIPVSASSAQKESETPASSSAETPASSSEEKKSTSSSKKETVDYVTDVFDALEDNNYAIDDGSIVTNVLSDYAVYMDYGSYYESQGYSDYGLVDSSAKGNNDGYWYFTYNSKKDEIALESIIYAGCSDSLDIVSAVVGDGLIDFEDSYADGLWETDDDENFSTTDEDAIYAVLELGVGSDYADSFECDEATFVVDPDDLTITVSFSGDYDSQSYDFEFTIYGEADMDISSALDDYYDDPESYHWTVTGWDENSEYYMNYFGIDPDDVPFYSGFTCGGSGYYGANLAYTDYTFKYTDQLSGDICEEYATELEEDGWVLDADNSGTDSTYGITFYAYINADETLEVSFFYMSTTYFTNAGYDDYAELYCNGLFNLTVETYSAPVDVSTDELLNDLVSDNFAEIDLNAGYTAYAGSDLTSYYASYYGFTYVVEGDFTFDSIDEAIDFINAYATSLSNAGFTLTADEVDDTNTLYIQAYTSDYSYQVIMGIDDYDTGVACETAYIMFCAY